MKRQIRSYIPLVPSKTVCYHFRLKWAKSMAFSDHNGAKKNIPFGATHTYMAYIRELPPGVSTTVLLLGAAQFCNFRGSKKGGTKSKKNWVLFETFDTLHGSGSPDILSPFWNILSNWKSLGSKLLQNPGSLSGKIMTQTKEKKSIETVRRYKSSM